MVENINTFQFLVTLFLVPSLLAVALVEFLSSQSLKQVRRGGLDGSEQINLIRKRLVLLNRFLIVLLLILVPVVVYEIAVLKGYWIYLLALLAVVYRFRITSELFLIETYSSRRERL